VKFAISNIALPSYHHQHELYSLREIGFEGLEVAPSKVWEDTKNITFAQVKLFRRQVEVAGLEIIGLHSLFFDQPGLGLFRGEQVRKNTLNFLVHLSKICADLGGRTLVFGSPAARQRKDLPTSIADEETVLFFSDLSEAIKLHGTFFVIEALGANETDYIHSVLHALEIMKKVNCKELQSHLDAKALVDACEVRLDIFQKVAPTLVHFHANDPGLVVLGETGEVDHALLGNLLKKINYNRYISLEQRMMEQSDYINQIKRSYLVLEKYYQ